MARLSIMDAAFLQMESPQTPAHVGGLQIFEPPKGREKDFLQDLIAEFEKGGKVEEPFNQRLKVPTFKLLDPLPSWETDPEFDLNYHVRFAGLPRPGNNDQLFTLVERLHSRQLDRTRPLWELYCIEGLEGGRVAIYTKIHHALVDGVSGMKLMAASLSTDPDAKSGKAPWQVDTRRKHDPDVAPPPAASAVAGLRNMLETQLGTLPEIGKNFQSMIKQLAGQQEGDLAIPFTAPATPFNTDVGQHRRFAVETLSVPEVKALGAVFGATVNDVVLAICSGALRSYLKQHSQLPSRPLITICPVSIRPKDGEAGGNQISFIAVDLATHVPDPVERLRAIKASAQAAKDQMADMSPEGKKNFAILMNSMNAMIGNSNLLKALPPPANLVISNVPGPPVPFYLYGAKLVGMYPVSVLTHGQALNITITSTEDRLAFGLIADRAAVPDLRWMASLIRSSYEELVKAAGMDVPETTAEAAE